MSTSIPINKDKPEAEDHHMIIIDAKSYFVKEDQIQGKDLRELADPHIPESRDLYQVIDGQPDRRVSDQEIIEVKDGLRFFSAPARIDAGRGRTTKKP